MNDDNGNTAAGYCLGDGLRAFLQSQDPFALPFRGPTQPCIQGQLSRTLVFCGCWEVSGLQGPSQYRELSESGIQQALTQTGLLPCFVVEQRPPQMGELPHQGTVHGP